MDAEETSALISKLVEKSEQKKIDWQQTADNDTYLATIQGKTFKIAAVYDGWGNHVGTELTMANEVGKEIWNVNTQTANELGINDEIRKLLKVAQYKADRVEEKISEALRALDSL